MTVVHSPTTAAKGFSDCCAQSNYWSERKASLLINVSIIAGVGVEYSALVFLSALVFMNTVM